MRAIICGRGGQGVVTLNMLLGSLAATLGYKTISAETHGMAMRGGSVYTSLKIDEGSSAAIEEGAADLILGTDASETIRNLKFLSKNGMVITNGKLMEKTPFKVVEIDASLVAMETFGRAAEANSILLGAVMAAFPKIFHMDKCLNILKENKKINVDAVRYGAEKVEKCLN